MRIWLVAASIAGAFIAAAAIGAVMYVRPQGGLAYDRSELRRLREQASFGVLLPTKLPDGFRYLETAPIGDPAAAGVEMVFARGDARIGFAQSLATASAQPEGEPVVVAGTVGTYFEGPWPAAPGFGPVLTWTQDQVTYWLTAAGGPGRDDLLAIAASLRPLDDVLR